MSVRILTGTYDGTQEAAALVDSVTGTAFGPLFADPEEAEGFLAWLGGEGVSARSVPGAQLGWLLARYREERAA